MAQRKDKHKPYLHEQKNSYASRRVTHRPYRQRFLIVCEGKETEVNYFRAFRAPRDVRSIDVQGIGYNTLSLVERTLQIKEEIEASKDVTFNQVWCVFDRDSFSPQNFHAAIELATKNGIKVAYSNEAFEIWYLLHFDYHCAALSRNQYKSMLTKRLRRKYLKNDPEIYNLLSGLQKIAIKNARKLNKSYSQSDSHQNNPSTTVHLLVQALNKYSPDARK